MSGVAGVWVRRLVVAAAVVVVVGGVVVSAGGQSGGFSDVGGVHEPAVGALDGLGVFEGTVCGVGEFCPREPVRRSTMAVWLVRVLGEEPAVVGVSRFVDVDAGGWEASYVERLAELGVTLGCGSGPPRFCPDGVVTRAQMASFLVRAFGLGDASPAGFVDTAGGVHAGSIDRLAAAGVTAGCRLEPLRFCPRDEVTRAQMASFLARAAGLVTIPQPDTSQPGTYKAVTAGYNHGCALATDGTITCWGSNYAGRVDAPEGTYKAVTAGGGHTDTGGGHSCALATDDTITCWGSNDYGQADAP